MAHFSTPSLVKHSNASSCMTMKQPHPNGNPLQSNVHWIQKHLVPTLCVIMGGGAADVAAGGAGGAGMGVAGMDAGGMDEVEAGVVGMDVVGVGRVWDRLLWKQLRDEGG